MLSGFIIARNIKKKKENNNKISNVVENYENNLGHFDCTFSILRLKKFHITPQLEQQFRDHINHMKYLFWYLQLPITTKIHLLENYILNFTLNSK